MKDNTIIIIGDTIIIISAMLVGIFYGYLWHIGSENGVIAGITIMLFYLVFNPKSQ
jgi:hypothetical protein